MYKDDDEDDDENQALMMLGQALMIPQHLPSPPWEGAPKFEFVPSLLVERGGRE